MVGIGTVSCQCRFGVVVKRRRASAILFPGSGVVSTSALRRKSAPSWLCRVTFKLAIVSGVRGLRNLANKTDPRAYVPLRPTGLIRAQKARPSSSSACSCITAGIIGFPGKCPDVNSAFVTISAEAPDLETFRDFIHRISHLPGSTQRVDALHTSVKTECTGQWSPPPRELLSLSALSPEV